MQNTSAQMKRQRLIVIVLSITVALAILFLIVRFINLGGFDGIKVRRTWGRIETFLNQYTNDDFKIVSQNGSTIKISFDDNGLLDFSCWGPSVFNMGFSTQQCSFKLYYGDNTTDRIGRYYLLKNLQVVDKMVDNYSGISIVDKRFDDYRRLSFSDDGQLKSFFYELIEDEDFKNIWEMYRYIVPINGKIEETQSVNEDNPINILDPNAIYLDIKVRSYYDYIKSDYESLFDYAYERGW